MIFKLSYDNFKEYLQLLYLIETKYNDMFHLFKNDGWILHNEHYSSDDDLIEEHKKAFKLKPRHLLTIDLMFKDFQWLTYDNYDNNDNSNVLHSFKEFDINCSDFVPKDDNIYRCYPIFDSNDNLVQFESRDLRLDKKTPNSKEIVNQVISIVSSKKCVVKSLLECLRLNEASYYTKEHFRKAQKTTPFNRYNKTYSQISGNVLDLGGGYKSKSYLKHASNLKSCLATDNDMTCVVNNIIMNANANANANSITSTNYMTNCYEYRFLDFTKRIADYKDAEKMMVSGKSINNYQFDVILAINCINYALSNLEVFFEHLNRYSTIGTKMIIRFMDYSVLEKCINSDETNIIIKSPYDTSFINYDTSSKSNKIYFEWTHDSPINEKCINRNELEDVFSKNGWKSICYETNPSLTNNPNKTNKTNNPNKTKSYSANTSLNVLVNQHLLWKHYFDSFSCITFEKN